LFVSFEFFECIVVLVFSINTLIGHIGYTLTCYYLNLCPNIINNKIIVLYNNINKLTFSIQSQTISFKNQFTI
jgi:hypothetical protein